MLANQLAETIRYAPLRTLDDLSREVWRAMVSGTLSENDAQRLTEAVEARRTISRSVAPFSHSKPSLALSGRPWSYFPAKRPQRSLDHSRSVERRRTLAASSLMPPKVAARFTTGEAAALAIVATECGTAGRCTLTVSEIAARAGVSATTVRNAVRQAARNSLLTTKERRQHCAPNLANLIQITSPEWTAWISRRFRDLGHKPGRGGGCKNSKATNKQGFKVAERALENRLIQHDTLQSHASEPLRAVGMIAPSRRS